MSFDIRDREELLNLGSATVYEASGVDCFLEADFRPAWDGAEMVGTALPVTAQIGDNLALHHAIEAANPGDVLVVNAGNAPFGYWGEVMAVAAQSRSLAGLIIDGGVRDTEALRRLGFPAFSTSIAIRGTGKQWAGTIGLPVTLRGRVVHHGDIVVADRDGVAIVPQDIYDATLISARERERKEQLLMSELRDGKLTLDVYNFRKLGTPLNHP